MQLLAAVLGIAGVICSPAKAETFYYLVRQWPTTYCKAEARCTTFPDSNAFSIHGLWPNYDRGGWPENCTNEQYDPSAVSDIRAQLTRSWESYSELNDEFWAHEWECHGTCTRMDQTTFFETVLSLNQRYNLEDALESASIVPNDRQTYSTADIADAIQKAYGAEPTVRCANRRQRGKQLLDSVFMCFNQHLEPEDCEDACPSGACEKSNCRMALYPPVDSLDDSPWAQEDGALLRSRGRSECKRSDHGPGTDAMSAS